MADLQQYLENTRKLVPYSDEEICELYSRARSAQSSPPPIKKEFKYKNSSDDVAADSILNAIFVGLLSLVVFPGNYASQIMLALGFVTGLVCAKVGATNRIIGLKTFFTHQEDYYRQLQTFTAESTQPKRVDVTDPEVLALVMRYLSKEPMDRSLAIQGVISKQRHKIRISLEDLEVALNALHGELDACVSDELRLLLLSQQSAALDYHKQLREADAVLINQEQQAKDAIAPVQEFLARIASIGRISDTLERVRAAHNVIDQSHEAITMNRLELSLLAQVSKAAVARLKDIEGLVQATRNAQLELEASTRTN